MSRVVDPLKRDRWARLRFSIIGPLLAAPPEAGDLLAALTTLSAKRWRHPTSGQDVCFALSTLERWYYLARRSADPVAALRNRLRSNIGRFPSLSPRAVEVLTTPYREPPGWTAQLHFDNLRVALAGSDSPLPSYPTIRRTLKAQGMFRQARPKRATAGALQARDRLEQGEVRSFEGYHSTTCRPSGISISLTPVAVCSIAPGPGSSRCCSAQSTTARVWFATCSGTSTKRLRV